MQANPLRSISETTKVDARSDQSEAATNKPSFQTALSSQVQAKQRQARHSQQKTHQDDKKNGVKVDDKNHVDQKRLNDGLETTSNSGKVVEEMSDPKFVEIARATDIILSLSIKDIQANDVSVEDPGLLTKTEMESTGLSPDAIASMSFLQSSPSAPFSLPDNKKVNTSLAEGKDSLRELADVSLSAKENNSKPILDVEDKQGVGANQKGVLGESGWERSNSNGMGISQKGVEVNASKEKTDRLDAHLLRNGESGVGNPKQIERESEQALSLTKANYEKISAPAEKIGNDATLSVNLGSILQANSSIAMQQVVNSNNIAAYPGKSGWDQAISQKVLWMIGAGEQSATLTLNPPDLGPLQVVIRVHNDQADTTFMSDNAEVRKALENGLPTLREKMNESGIQLGQANVSTNSQSQHSFQQATQSQLTRQTSGGLLNDVTQTVLSGESNSTNYVSNGLVDTFA
jgi:flagellar hook-length control protein FliK